MAEHGKRKNTYRNTSSLKRIVRWCRYCTEDNTSNDHPKKCLIRAVRWGNMRVTKSLTDTFGLSYSKVWADGYSLLRHALRHKHPELAKFLLTRGARVNSKSKSSSVTPLHLAVLSGDADIVSMLLDRNANVNASDSWNCTPLNHAVDGSYLEIVKLLIERNARFDGETLLGKTALFTALDKGYFLIVKELLYNVIPLNNAGIANSIDKNCTQLHLAVFKQNKYHANLLLKLGADIEAKMTNDKTALHVATSLMDPEMIVLLLNSGANIDAKDENGRTALHLASKFGYIEIVKILLANKANIDTVDNSRYAPLQYAAEKNNFNIVKILIDNGADVNAKQEYNKMTALHIASKKGHVNVVKILVESNAHLDAEDVDGCSPLHLASVHDRFDVVERLITLGANIEAKNWLGRTALHLAAKHRCPSVVRILLDHGADVNVTCNDLMTPLDYAHLIGLPERYDFIVYTEDGPARYKAVVLILAKHIIALMAIDLYVSTRNFMAIDSNEDCIILKNYRNEISNMKTQLISYSTVSFYDILTGNHNQLVNYARNENIVNAIFSKDFNSRFPTYCNMIIRRIREGQKRINLLSLGFKSLTELFNGHFLPDVFTNELFNYLTNNDLENLINADPSDNYYNN